ncbi:cytochrome P450 [Sistotremastrum niveocremeum HHB9708]|uniref:Cytochrome P450 n=1 Tax=Sistotremastrum niveocremeum HHB9708 TaxID=1314777 RepID=A0A164XYA9_9AGAM|nr:cytochrome P450 [Sistotremastrum niveocremeum HHB9708]
MGPSGVFSSYSGALRFLKHGDKVLEEAYMRYRKRGIFKVADLARWIVVIISPELLEDLKRAQDDHLSFSEGVAEFVQVDWTLGPNVHKNDYHVPIVRSQFTRSLTAMYPEIHDEICSAISDQITPQGEEWISINAIGFVSQVVARANNRTFVGLPLCRDPEFLELNLRYTMDVVIGAEICRPFPVILKGIVARLFTPVAAATKKATKKLQPLIRSRYSLLRTHGKDYEDKPLDFLSFLMDEAVGIEKDPEELSRRILVMNFAANSTTSMSFTHVLFFIAGMPEYVAPLREEVEGVIAAEGWTRTALSKCHKLDSFIKETMRLRGAGKLSTLRMAVKDFTFSDGTFIPKGTIIQGLASGRHEDPEIYGESAAEFDGFRFDNLRNAGDVTKHQAVSVGLDYLAFGLGKPACPGRFFAVLVMKTMLAHILLHYDVKNTSDKIPLPSYMNASCIPDSSANVMFRKRQ